MHPENLLDLADIAQAAESSLSKAHVICRELCEHYFHPFGQDCASEDARQNFIVWEHGHYALYAHIIQDYILQAEAGIVSLSVILHDYLNQNVETTWGRRDYQPQDKKRA